MFNYNNKVYNLLLEIGITKSILDSNSDYAMNAGVILYNNQKINNENKADKLINLSLKYSSYLECIDEYTIAAVFKDKIKAAEVKYNYWIPNENYILNIVFRAKTDLLLKNAVIYYFGGKVKSNNFSKLFKIPKPAYKEVYKYLQMSYLKVNHVKLWVVFGWAKLKCFRLKLLGVR